VHDRVLKLEHLCTMPSISSTSLFLLIPNLNYYRVLIELNFKMITAVAQIV
jgi:hypothetical protein